MNDVVKQHYSAPGLLERITKALAGEGKVRDSVTIDDLGPVDEFHIGGMGVTAELIDRLAADESMHVLDLGCGLGGPARRLANTVGCRVTGIDLSADFCTAGRTLNAWTQLSDKVTLVQGDATDLAGLGTDLYDAAWTLHVGMNIADKGAAYDNVFAALKPGGRFLVYDVLGIEGQDVLYPAPWARDQSGSYLSTKDAMVGYLSGAGFAVESVEDRTPFGRTFLEKGLKQSGAMSSPRPLGLHLVLGTAAKEILPLVKRNLDEGRLAIGLFECRKTTT
ncbi:MAG: SAM-dependent methyltransferase [Alphaproteobacteria bacterium]